MGERGRRFLSPIELVRRAGLTRIIEWLIVGWMYLWIAGFALAIIVATVRGYAGVFRETRAYERTLSKKGRVPAKSGHEPSKRRGGHARDSTHGDTG